MIGHRIIQLDAVDSTNLYAERWLQNHTEEDGTIIVARDQTAGKGQGENRWQSEPGSNLTFTIILHPDFLDPALQFRLNKALALGISDFVRQQTKPVPCFLKWPNDIYVNNRKLCGILIQHRVSGSTLETTLAGIGVNVNQTVFPPEIANPVSLKQITGKVYDPEELLPVLLKRLDARYRQLQQGLAGKLHHDYHSRLLGYGKWNRYRVGDEWIEGFLGGVDEYGQLVIRDIDGREHFFSHGELKFQP